MLFYHDTKLASQGAFTDLRKDRAATIEISNLFYLVFKVKIGNASWYHHEVCVFDFNLREAIIDMGNRLRDLVSARAQVTLVFLRGLIMEDNNVIDAMFSYNMHREYREALASGNLLSDETTSYLTFGYVGENSLTMIPLEADDGLDACSKANGLCREQLNKGFSVIQVCAISPAIEEIDEHYEAQMPHILGLLSAPKAVAR